MDSVIPSNTYLLCDASKTNLRLFLDNNSPSEVVLGRGKRPRDPECMKALALAAAASSDDDKGPSHPPKKRLPRKRMAAAIDSNDPPESYDVEMSSDAGDDDFIAHEQSGSNSESSETGSDIEELTNAEVCIEST
jgi:hypothetical protein